MTPMRTLLPTARQIADNAGQATYNQLWAARRRLMDSPLAEDQSRRRAVAQEIMRRNNQPTDIGQ